MRCETPASKRPHQSNRRPIPLVLEGHDLIGCAQTGTGKTAAFALPILSRILQSKRGKKSHIRTLVLAPTRELAAQIGESFEIFSKHTKMRTQVVFGGVKKPAQIKALRNPPEILVATPGRLLDLLSDRVLSLTEVEYAVLDEADRMLDMGFIHDVRRIMKTLPAKRQTLLFSATMPREVEKLAAQFLSSPRRVAVKAEPSVSKPIEQTVHFVEKKQKIVKLISTLQNESQALVFTRTKHGANKVVRQLGKAGITAAAIHGNKSQSARESALAAFKNGSTRIVVATDLASRGLDIKELPLVINYDLPNEPEVYVHRIGRTGRAGAIGTAISFCSRDELPYLKSIERLTGERIERSGREPQVSTDEIELDAKAKPQQRKRSPRRMDTHRQRPQQFNRKPEREEASPDSSQRRPTRTHAKRRNAGEENTAPKRQRPRRSNRKREEIAESSPSQSRPARTRTKRDRDGGANATPNRQQPRRRRRGNRNAQAAAGRDSSARATAPSRH